METAISKEPAFNERRWYEQITKIPKTGSSSKAMALVTGTFIPQASPFSGVLVRQDGLAVRCKMRSRLRDYCLRFNPDLTRPALWSAWMRTDDMGSLSFLRLCTVSFDTSLVADNLFIVGGDVIHSERSTKTVSISVRRSFSKKSVQEGGDSEALPFVVTLSLENVARKHYPSRGEFRYFFAQLEKGRLQIIESHLVCTKKRVPIVDKQDIKKALGVLEDTEEVAIPITHRCEKASVFTIGWNDIWIPVPKNQPPLQVILPYSSLEQYNNYLDQESTARVDLICVSTSNKRQFLCTGANVIGHKKRKTPKILPILEGAFII